MCVCESASTRVCACVCMWYELRWAHTASCENRRTSFQSLLYPLNVGPNNPPGWQANASSCWATPAPCQHFSSLVYYPWSTCYFNMWKPILFFDKLPQSSLWSISFNTPFSVFPLSSYPQGFLGSFVYFIWRYLQGLWSNHRNVTPDVILVM